MKENISKIRSDADKFLSEIKSLEATYGRLVESQTAFHSCCYLYYQDWLKEIDKGSDIAGIKEKKADLDGIVGGWKDVHQEITTLLSYMSLAIAFFRKAANEYQEAVLKEYKGKRHE